MADNINHYLEVYASDCPIRQTLDHISDKWTTLIIGVLESGPKRFSDIQRNIGGISQKMLTQTLRRLERNGLVSRTVYAEVPPRVEYELTPLGKTICEPLQAIINWAQTNIDAGMDAQACYDAKSSIKDKEGGE